MYFLFEECFKEISNKNKNKLLNDNNNINDENVKEIKIVKKKINKRKNI